MNNRELKTIIKLFENSTLASMKLERDDVTIELQKPDESRNEVVSPRLEKPAKNSQEPALSHESEDSKVTSGPAYDPIKAPLVGTYYEAGGPDQPPFVKENQMVKKGETVCIIEAMKVMNEITAPKDGKIVKLHVHNGDAVMVDQTLMEMA